jgi:8-oxo-dGTP pyrophosphatase MutT (NUDIX family)
LKAYSINVNFNVNYILQENSEEAVVRELREEAGIFGRVVEPIGTFWVISYIIRVVFLTNKKDIYSPSQRFFYNFTFFFN